MLYKEVGVDSPCYRRGKGQFREVWVSTDRDFSGVRGPNFTILGQDIGRSSQHCTFVSEFGCFAAFSKMRAAQS